MISSVGSGCIIAGRVLSIGPTEYHATGLFIGIASSFKAKGRAVSELLTATLFSIASSCHLGDGDESKGTTESSRTRGESLWKLRI